MNYQGIIFFILTMLFCACSTHQENNIFYQNNLLSQNCDAEFFKKEGEKIKQNRDLIFRGLNAAYIARDCKDFHLSNSIFDRVERAYKYDVDLQNLSTKSKKAILSTFINEGINDYEGAWYERTMLNVYKGLNFMSLGDFINARVEFNRALMRQEMAKDYFAFEIENAYKRAKKQINSKDKLDDTIKTISNQYQGFFKEFNAQKNYTNPYITYISAVFFFMDGDYIRARDLLKELYAIYPLNEEIQKAFEIFNAYSSSLNPDKLQKYIFIIYENGLSPALDEFSLSLPIVFDRHIITSTISLPILKKRNISHDFLRISNDREEFTSSEVFDFDQIVASEFKAQLSAKILRSLSSSILKTGLNALVSKNDTSGILSFATNVFSIMSTRSDLRFWNFLPKNIQILMVKNHGFIEIRDDNHQKIYSSEVHVDENLLIIVRSFDVKNPARIYKIGN